MTTYTLYNLSDESAEALIAHCLYYLEFAYFSLAPDAELADVFWDYGRKDVIDLIKILSAINLVQKASLSLELRRKCVSHNNGEALGGSYQMTEQGRQLLENYRKRVGYTHE